MIETKNAGLTKCAIPTATIDPAKTARTTAFRLAFRGESEDALEITVYSSSNSSTIGPSISF